MSLDEELIIMGSLLFKNSSKYHKSWYALSFFSLFTFILHNMFVEWPILFRGDNFFNICFRIFEFYLKIVTIYWVFYFLYFLNIINTQHEYWPIYCRYSGKWLKNIACSIVSIQAWKFWMDICWFDVSGYAIYKFLCREF